MRERAANLIGWAMIAALTAICFVLDALHIQYTHFNWFIIFVLAASAALVIVQIYLARRTKGPAGEQQQSESGRPTS